MPDDVPHPYPKLLEAAERERPPARECLWTFIQGDHEYSAVLKFHPLVKFEAVVTRDDELLTARRFPQRAAAVAWLEVKRAGR